MDRFVPAVCGRIFCSVFDRSLVLRLGYVYVYVLGGYFGAIRNENGACDNKFEVKYFGYVP